MGVQECTHTLMTVLSGSNTIMNCGYSQIYPFYTKFPEGTYWWNGPTTIVRPAGLWSSVNLPRTLSVATPPSYYRRIRRGVITYYQGIEGALPLIITYHVWSLDRPNYPFCLLFSIVHEAHDYIGTMSGLSQYSNHAWPVTCIGTMSGLSQYSNTAWPVTVYDSVYDLQWATILHKTQLCKGYF